MHILYIDIYIYVYLKFDGVANQLLNGGATLKGSFSRSSGIAGDILLGFIGHHDL